jgi:hypothetical protein
MVYCCVEVEDGGEVVGHPTTLAPRRSGPTKRVLLTDRPRFTCQLWLIYGATW